MAEGGEGLSVAHHFQAGDRVMWRFTWWDWRVRDANGVGYVHDVVREGVVECTARDSKMLKINFVNLRGCEDAIWRSARRVMLIDREVPKEQKRPAVVDARVLEELTALQKQLGSTDAVIDLLQSIRDGWEGKKGEKHGG